MSQTEKSSPKLWQYCCAILIITTVLFAALAAIGYSQLGSAQSRNNDLSTKVDSLNAQISNLNSQIASLQTQVAQLQTQASANQATIAQLQAKIDSLNGQIAGLKAQLAALPKVDWTAGIVKVPVQCGFLGLSRCEPVAIEFTDASTGTVYSSTVKMNLYGLWLLNNTAYSPISVIETSSFLGLISIQMCTPVPPTFTPTTNPASQSFSC